MKIITEAINQEPSHSVTKKDIETVIKYVPKDWIGVAHVFLIAEQKFENSNWDRPVVQNQTTFRILSRGLEKKIVIKELLIELAVTPARIYPMKSHKLNKEQRRKLEEMIQPYYKRISAELQLDEQGI
ncbi:hypothetical protein I2I11_11870 [Pontibacter sp. 172403-2]|uniref:hypothetical protein n=1 Tax=Pontibacter rufus TaxID=2791028 RepID=UPI0018AF6715|nr:hypothetical protein [Pontibacter sp. 172403-2]MBF9253991.1 hypothetical protein [Pontibacter sp. 172403-2]